ncbi:diacylglycerol kinase [Candidatus Gottesmanbacteria bacterium CG11_big_fil_rev_8_21_14_0_20_37_11]|uniref:Dihydrofolate reductase n=3 Tax=Candidatus Gottesmaniibacteriota TaxID=1752720 RepID=A0A2M7RS87_9BACT|nr:MAG: hypothetical protein AUJ73_00010 [Candidatus Gottesmanbacteria bacterium CG1_02_37_22]PIP32346.1 MAG: diacylglycerol kinase [Candidatus Gottesmanbacteria bacterium CG23_combo_of_CG06-09_8_20_14_all_37_19]PIR07816.1 MAG: diacylglycerol kinase [Candidatus Gottesmanbacteria bacterium CG11_big_fil_rev_8_21_14_0_20_37_11]PIZ02834.1 MAG: diacylglycerol kinase [Candidatus Gottesmanbacteria bacterium CG_4_10_14_0_8_um_filter_37_24]
MQRTKISIIAAIAENRAIGKNNKLLWHIPQDMKHFRKITSGHPVVMGRKTYESLGRPLPDRTNIVVTRDKLFRAKGCIICYSLDIAIRTAGAKDSQEIFIIGGGKIYEQAITLADKLYLTVVKGNYEADTYFPDYSDFKKVVSRKDREDSKYKFTFLELERP